MVDYLIDVSIEVIQTLDSLLLLAYDPGLEPLLTMVAGVDIQPISVRVLAVMFEGPTIGYFEGRNEN